MADLNVIYRIAADITGLQDGVKRAATATEGLQSTFKTMGTVLAGAFTALQVGQAAKEVVAFTDRVTDLAAKSGISASAVQELDYVAKQSGSSFDTISQALALMGDRLVSGDKSTVGALEKLGLSLSDLQAMAPDKAFETIAGAIAKIEDPMLRSNTAIDLFGKSGADLLPVLTSDISGLRDRAKELGLIMGDDVVKAGADLDDKFAELDTRMKTLQAQALLPLMGAFTEMPGWLQTSMFAVSEFGGALAGIATTVMMAGGPMAALAGLKTALLTMAGLLTIPAGLVVAAVAGLVGVFLYWDEITAIAERVYNGVKTWLVDKFQAVVDSIKGKIDAVTGFFGTMYDKVVGKSFVPNMMNQIGTEFGRLNTVMVSPAGRAADAIGGIFEQLNGWVIGKVQGMLNGVGGMLGQFLNSTLSAFSSALSKGVASIINRVVGGGATALGIGGSTAGAVAGVGASIAAGVATMGVSLAVTGVIAGVKAWMGKKEHMAVNDIRDDFFNEHGGLKGVNEAAQGAGDKNLNTTKAIFGAKTKDAFSKAVEDWKSVTGMASGGLVRQPTLAMLGEAGPELITPLKDVGQMFGSGVVIHIHGGNYDTPAGRQDAANRISRAVMARQGLQQRFNTA